MCLIAWDWQPDRAVPLFLLANRDEFFARPAKSLDWWDDGRVLAGRDLQAGGTWLGVSRRGRLAALTNVRDPSAQRSDVRSRGELVAGFLQGEQSAAQYAEGLAARAALYNPFNLLLFDGCQLLGFESNQARSFTLPPGVHAVSNAAFDTPWPKLKRLKADLQSLTPAQRKQPEDVLALLQSTRVAPDNELPCTGIPLERERALSAAFICTPDYGTRACSVVSLGTAGGVFSEWSFNANGLLGHTKVAWDYR